LSFVGSDPSENQILQYVGLLTRQNFLSIHRAYHAIMLKHGMDQATLDEWSKHVDQGRSNDDSVDIFYSIPFS
jgi:hypothetical protein